MFRSLVSIQKDTHFQFFGILKGHGNTYTSVPFIMIISMHDYEPSQIILDKSVRSIRAPSTHKITLILNALVEITHEQIVNLFTLGD